MKTLGCLIVLMLLVTARLFGQADAGNEHFEKGNYREAAAAYERAAAEENSAGLKNRLGMAYHLTDRLKEAEAAYRASIQLDPKSANASNNLATLYFSQRKFSDAERQIRRAVEIDPEAQLLRRNLRAAKYARENSKRAREAASSFYKDKPLLLNERSGDLLEMVLLMPPDQIQTALVAERKGDSFLTRKMYDDAIQEYLRATVRDRYNAGVFNRLGIAYHQTHKLKEAEGAYRQALKVNPYYLEALNNLGSVEYVRKNYDRALSNYNRALKVRPESPTVLQNIGACLFAMEKYDEGLAIYRRALAIDPKLFQHSSGFGTLIQTAQRNESMMNFSMAKLFAEAGDKDRAISYLYKAVEEGFKDLEKLRAEKAFAILIEDERFTKLVAQMGAS